jgi:hypothetical protein
VDCFLLFVWHELCFYPGFRGGVGVGHISAIDITAGLFPGAWIHVSGFVDFVDFSGFAVFLGWASNFTVERKIHRLSFIPGKTLSDWKFVSDCRIMLDFYR